MLNCNEFEELEAVPTMAVMDGPLESTPSNAADVPEDPAFVNFFSTALTVGNTSNAAISAQPYQSNTTISLPSHPASVASPIVPTLQISSPPLSAPTPNLVKPSLFFVPPPSSYERMMKFVSSSTPTAPPLNPPLSVAAHMVPQCLNLFHHQPLHHLLLLLLLQTADHLSARRKSERHFWCLFRLGFLVMQMLEAIIASDMFMFTSWVTIRNGGGNESITVTLKAIIAT
ncbi:hypothetical protein WN943_025952 [Citrus x changshan-huyou]